MIDVIRVSGGYGKTDVLQDISFAVKPGEFLGILGPNGSGKTTLLKMLSGTIAPRSGEVLLECRSVGEYKTKELARKMAVLPQKTEQAFSFTVEETVQFGRYAYQAGLFRQLTAEDHDIVKRVMKQTDTLRFAQKSIHELSGGEQQRVYLAQALAQEPEYLLLDEPTSFLDLSFQKSLLDLMKQETAASKLAVVGVFHDVNIASLYCDRLLLLKDGKAEVLDRPEAALSAGRIGRVYDTDITGLDHPQRSNPQFTIMAKNIPRKTEPLFLKERIEQYLPHGIAFLADRPLRLLSSERGFAWRRKLIFDSGNNSGWPHGSSAFEQETLFIQHDAELADCHIVSESGDLCIVGMKDTMERLIMWVLVDGCLQDGQFVKAISAAAFAAAQHHVPCSDVLVAATQSGRSADQTAFLTQIQNKTAACVKALKD
ncbi:ABC transporter ATP-binding protein [Bacillus licheniformis]|uniref:ABC transporter ATP-binding protein n=1 Tax=Bacillus licheniformis TaxID=1402 RepID=UPI00018C8B1B|nr:ABC transporter ATP-binding protein [Bacillus licheniformis]MCA1180027.1 ABC transporter ATP-binding protein [Bacillus licheniformis]MCY7741769.1 ABC transporter ATP-binding protein [Bacillus licheniformis]MED4410835.1 ABC transporter ATP-binding protein [Bacillus licheniformis]QDL77871.1 ABC transporter ATP-binding protein [Bacillus licheniformis]TWK97035.1 Hemin import ATP-binding protein HmuV [Bacillus licheniformis]